MLLLPLDTPALPSQADPSVHQIHPHVPAFAFPVAHAIRICRSPECCLSLPAESVAIAQGSRSSLYLWYFCTDLSDPRHPSDPSTSPRRQVFVKSFIRPILVLCTELGRDYCALAGRLNPYEPVGPASVRHYRAGTLTSLAFTNTGLMD